MDPSLIWNKRVSDTCLKKRVSHTCIKQNKNKNSKDKGKAHLYKSYECGLLVWFFFYFVFSILPHAYEPYVFVTLV